MSWDGVAIAAPFCAAALFAYLSNRKPTFEGVSEKLLNIAFLFGALFMLLIGLNVAWNVVNSAQTGGATGQFGFACTWNGTANNCFNQTLAINATNVVTQLDNASAAGTWYLILVLAVMAITVLWYALKNFNDLAKEKRGEPGDDDEPE